MSHNLRKSQGIGVVSAYLVLLLCSSSSQAQSSAFGFRPLVKRGVPTANGESFFLCPACRADEIQSRRGLNSGGDVLIFSAATTSCPVGPGEGGGDYVISGGNSIRIADFCHETPSGRPTVVTNGSLNDSGQVALEVFSATVPGSEMLFSNGSLSELAEFGRATPAGSTFASFSESSINNNGDVVFSAHNSGGAPNGIFKWSGGSLITLVAEGDSTPAGGTFNFSFDPNPIATINDSGEVLFQGAVNLLNPPLPERWGLFLLTPTGIQKIEADGDKMPDGRIALPSCCTGDGNLNNAGQVAFRIRFTNKAGNGGVYRYTNGVIEKIVAVGDPSPIGGTFSSLSDQKFFPVPDLPPAIGGNGAVVFKARVSQGTASSGIFMGVPGAILKLVAPGDKLPDGETVSSVHTFAVNEKGQVAFFAYGPQQVTIGVYLATPVQPTITATRLKTKRGTLQLIVDGGGFITNNSVIEINGQAVSRISYPAGFQQNGGTTTRVVSQDSSLGELIPAGQAVQITVFNPMTSQRSAAFTLTR